MNKNSKRQLFEYVDKKVENREDNCSAYIPSKSFERVLLIFFESSPYDPQCEAGYALLIQPIAFPFSYR